MNIPIPELILASLIPLFMISTERGDVAGMIRTGDKTSERFVGTWTNYSPTQFSAMRVEFVENGTCQFHKGAEEMFSCKWEEIDAGRARIRATVSGREEVFSASMAGDYMVVREPGRETPYVRAKTRAAYERERLANGPSKSSIPWNFQPK